MHSAQLCLLEGQGEVVLAGLAVPHQVARLFAQPQQGLGVSPADGSVVPAAAKTGINKWVMVMVESLNKMGRSGGRHSHLALQGHAGVDPLAQGGAAVVQRRHLGVDQAAAGVPLQRPAFAVLGGRHAGLLHAVELDCGRGGGGRKIEEKRRLTTRIATEGDRQRVRRL